MALYKNLYRIEPARHPGWDYRRPGYYFITVCTADHRTDFGSIIDNEMHHSAIGAIAHRYFIEIPRHFPNADVDIVQIMPNHLHAIIVIDGAGAFPSDRPNIAPETPPMSIISPRTGSLSTIIRSYKAEVTKWCRRNRITDFRWKERFHDHIIRNEHELQRIRAYIRNNPANWHLDKSNRNP